MFRGSETVSETVFCGPHLLFRHRIKQFDRCGQPGGGGGEVEHLLRSEFPLPGVEPFPDPLLPVFRQFRIVDDRLLHNEIPRLPRIASTEGQRTRTGAERIGRNRREDLLPVDEEFAVVAPVQLHGDVVKMVGGEPDRASADEILLPVGLLPGHAVEGVFPVSGGNHEDLPLVVSAAAAGDVAEHRLFRQFDPAFERHALRIARIRKFNQRIRTFQQQSGLLIQPLDNAHISGNLPLPPVGT